MRIITLLVAGAALLLAGCGTKTITQQSEVNLVKLGIEKAHAGPAQSVSCPSNVAAKVGRTFDCHAVLRDGTRATFTLRVDSVSGDSGHMTIVGARRG